MSSLSGRTIVRLRNIVVQVRARHPGYPAGYTPSCMSGRVRAVITMPGRALATSLVRQRVGGILALSPTPALHGRRGPRSSRPVLPGVLQPGYLRPHLGEALASKAMRVLCAVSLLAASGFAALAFDELATTPIVVAPPMPRPDYLQAVTDPLLGTGFTRVTEPGRLLAAGISCNPAYCRHRYSSTQAWNADQSLLAINNGCNGICFLDGRTYEPTFHRPMDDDC